MHIEPTHSRRQTSGAGAVTICPNCRAEMPSEMRFCRSCGFRLGEGVAEYTETIRLEKAPSSKPQSTATNDARGAATVASPKLNAAASINDWGALARDVKSAVKSAAHHIESSAHHIEQERLKQQQQNQEPTKGKRPRSSWMGWIIALIIISVLSSGSFMGISGLRGIIRDSIRGSSSSRSAAATRSWVGTSTLKSTDQGVTFDRVEPQGSPADKAGLVGGDLIMSFDGKPVRNADDLRKLLAATPIGKTVELVYKRDGETKTTQITTVSEDEIERLGDAADDRAQGYVGIGSSREHVSIPGTNISGVQLNNIRRNNPAYIAGMRDGDIVIEFDGVPIRTYDELESRTRRAAPDSSVKVVVMRGTERLEIQVRVGVDD